MIRNILLHCFRSGPLIPSVCISYHNLNMLIYKQNSCRLDFFSYLEDRGDDLRLTCLDGDGAQCGERPTNPYDSSSCCSAAAFHLVWSSTCIFSLFCHHEERLKMSSEVERRRNISLFSTYISTLVSFSF